MCCFSLYYVDDTLLSGESDNKVLSIVDHRLNERFERWAWEEEFDSCSVWELRETRHRRDDYLETGGVCQGRVSQMFSMADARPTKSPSEAGPSRTAWASTYDNDLSSSVYLPA